MLPGGPHQQRQMQMMMRRMGMSTEAVEGVDEVIIRTRDKEHVFKSPEVTILTVQGVRTYQVVGESTVRPRGASSPTATAAELPAGPAAPVGPPEEDVQLVMEQGQVERDEALSALAATDGAPAEAILLLLSRRGARGGG
jgi:nascent polypeptide-associated complex subunit alpha